MADGFSVDSGSLERLTADLGALVAENVRPFRQAVEITARHVKDEWRDRLKGSEYVPGGPGTVTYDIAVTRDGIEAEIGPELGRKQASIVGILETGTPSNPSGRGFGVRALADNVEDFERGISKAIDDTLNGKGL